MVQKEWGGKLSKKEKRIGVQEKKLDYYILNMVIVNTKIVLYMNLNYVYMRSKIYL